jgi:hypothetical protein
MKNLNFANKFSGLQIPESYFVEFVVNYPFFGWKN